MVEYYILPPPLPYITSIIQGLERSLGKGLKEYAGLTGHMGSDIGVTRSMVMRMCASGGVGGV